MVERSKTMLYIAGRRCEPIVPMHAKNRPGRGTREAVALENAARKAERCSIIPQ